MRYPILLALTLVLACSSAPTTVTNPPPPPPGGTSDVTVIDGSLPSGGGVLTVNRPGDPLNGMQITLPANAFTAGIQLKVHYGDASGAPQRAGLRLVTPVMTIESNAAGYTSSAPMAFRIPATFSKHEWPIALLFNRATGAIEALPTVPIDTTAVVAMTRHINGDFLLPAAPGASIRTGASLRVGPVIQLVIGVVSYDKLAGDFDTGYRPNVDDWEFDHAFVLAPDNRSYNPGIPLAAAWYFSNFKSHGALNKQYQKAAGVEWSNPRGYKISAIMSAGIDEDALNRYNASLEVFATPEGVTLDSLIYLSVKAGMYSTGRPQIIYADDIGEGQTLASLLVYRTHANVLDVTLGTSSTGIDAPRSLTLTQQHFAPLEWKTKDPDTGGIVTTMLAHYGVTGATASISFANVDQAWQQFFAGTIGDGVFAKAVLVSRDYRPVKDTLFIPDDSTRVWLECATCDGGFPVTTTAIQPQGNLAAGILYFEDAPGNWTGGTSTMRGNGLGAGDAENLDHPGFAVIGYAPGKHSYFLDWIDFVIKTKRLTISPKPLTADVNTDYVLTATYDRPMPANPSWVWNLGDGRTITTPTGTLTVNYPADPAHPTRNLDLKVSLKSGTTLEATGHESVTVVPALQVWKFTQAAVTFSAANDDGISNDGRWKVDSTILARISSGGSQGGIRLVDVAFTPPGSPLRTAPAGLYLLEGASITLATLDDPATENNFVTTTFPNAPLALAAAPRVSGWNLLDQSLPGNPLCNVNEDSYVRTGTITNGHLTGLRVPLCVQSIILPHINGQRLMSMDADVTFNGAVATGTISVIYYFYGNGLTANFFQRVGRLTFTATRVTQ